MPYSLSISPSIFQTFINEAFWEFLHRFVIVYIDDILIYSQNWPNIASTSSRSSPSSAITVSTSSWKNASSIVHLYSSWVTSSRPRRLMRPPPERVRYCPKRSVILHSIPVLLPKAVTGGAKLRHHKNLKYIREAKRLNPRQARWAPFFTLFNFKIICRPGSKNISADALSRLYSNNQSVKPEPILPSNLIVSPIRHSPGGPLSRHSLRRKAQKAKSFFPLPYVKAFWAQLIGLWALDTPAANGPSRSYNLDTGGPVCAGIPSGKLVPLRIPQRPWSHIGVDFVTDPPAAEGNTCILVMVDHFSKMCKFSLSRVYPLRWRRLRFCSNTYSVTSACQRGSCRTGTSIYLSHERPDRKIQELGRYLRAYGHEDQHSWSRFLPWAKYAQNSLRQDTTGLTLFQCVLWYQPPLFPWTEKPSNVPAVDHWFRERECGTQLITISNGPCDNTRDLLTSEEDLLLITILGISRGQPCHKPLLHWSV
ncbi:Transposon Ty3-G Gag-Pol polyprotein [Labeo rohita]|uniref:Transposon Ty3-G Gag-Pol polyprotein n=1 Tax=Labeo rohita TaxID=84645 RepID=A0ABQ8MVD3_LABRO|nr:Transposon Ty3-G Gag-Pol polyprotein [Labeo rohita]